MTDLTHKHNDEIDLAAVIKTIWSGKWIIILFVFISTSLGIGYNYTVKEKPSLFEISSNIYPNENSEFVKFININRILLSKNFKDHTVTNKLIFKKFINQLSDYETIISALKDNTIIQEKISKLSNAEKKEALLVYAKAFTLDEYGNKGDAYHFKFNWSNENDGILILNDFLNLMTSKLNNKIINNLEDILEAIKRAQIEEDFKRIDFLLEQKGIAKELNINKSEINLSTPSYQYPLPKGPEYYLRGYNAIDKEISLIKTRKYRDEIFLSEQIDLLKKNADTVWVKYNLLTLEIKLMDPSAKKRVLIISIVLGLIIGIICALIFNFNRKQKRV